jgi:septal ring factor EnvC (AmiA/AmiB activator)
MFARRMTSSRTVHRPVLIAIAGVTILLSGCSQGASQAQLAQAQQSAAQAQAQKDTQAALSAQVQQLKDQAAQTEAAKTAAAQAAATQSAATQAAAAQAAAAQAAAAKAAAAAAQPQTTSCDANVSAGANTTCVFALNVESAYYASGGGYSTVSVYSPVTGLYYGMTCTPGVPTVCRGGNNAVVYIR